MRRRMMEIYRDFKHGTLGRPYLPVRATDCFLVSFPRSGNTWMRYMLLHALKPGGQWELPSIEQTMPIVDRPDLKRLLHRRSTDEPYRLFKSHDALTPYFFQGRVVYIVRDGRDAVSSYYHYRVHMNQMKLTWPDYLRRSLAGRYRYGAWRDHVRGWLAHRDNPAMRVLRYEQMLESPKTALKSVIEHFGLAASDQAIAAAVEQSSVQRVSEGFAKVASQQDRQFTGGTGGGAGKWRAKFSEQEATLFEQSAGDLLRDLGYER